MVNPMKTRLLGCALTLICALLIWQLHVSVTSVAPHQPQAGELILALLATLSGFMGAMLIAAGNTLFETPR